MMVNENNNNNSVIIVGDPAFGLYKNVFRVGTCSN